VYSVKRNLRRLKHYCFHKIIDDFKLITLRICGINTSHFIITTTIHNLEKKQLNYCLYLILYFHSYIKGYL